jgi:hypothetical protein
MRKKIHILLFLMLSLAMVSCEITPLNQAPTLLSMTETTAILTQSPAQTIAPLATVNPSPLETVSNPPGINPLTGLPVKEPDNLKLPPILASIPNFPPSARPQAGLSFSPIVFELFIGDGMTRNLAVFYGDYPEQVKVNQGAENFTSGLPEPAIGPIRSGRVSYEKIRELFNGFLVMASAYKGVAEKLNQYTNIYGSDTSDVNSAMLKVSRLKEIALSSQKVVGEAALSGMVFDPIPPQGGQVAHSLWLFYANLNQIFWRYNESDGFFHRFQDNADGSTFIEATDRLNGEALKYSNVIVLFVKHEVHKKYVIDLDLLYKKREDALLFRDGKVYKIYWTTRSEEYEKATGKLRPIRFIDYDGNPFPLKPGQTWINVIPIGLEAWETVDSVKYNQLMAGNVKGSGYWAIRFKEPK